MNGFKLCAAVAAGIVMAGPGRAMEGFGSVEFLGAAAPDHTVNNRLPGDPLSSTLGFNIILNYNNTPTAAEAAAFASAEAAWESLILGYQSNDLANTNLNIDVNLAFIDGEGNVLGSAGPSTAKLNAAQNAVNPDFVYTQSGAMTFDTADTAALNSSGTLDEVIFHEMGHVLGIGTLWSSSAVGFAGRQEVYVNNTGQYTGAAGLAAYNSEFNQSGTFVPVELGGGGGTANGHWDEFDFGAGFTGPVSNITGQDMTFEIMTGWLNAPAFTSSLTVQSLVDIGYVVIPEPTTLSLLSIGTLVLLRRRQAD